MMGDVCGCGEQLAPHMLGSGGGGCPADGAEAKTTLVGYWFLRRGVAQPGSARRSGRRGPRFESGRPD
jgi:hypothetical protein